MRKDVGGFWPTSRAGSVPTPNPLELQGAWRARPQTCCGGFPHPLGAPTLATLAPRVQPLRFLFAHPGDLHAPPLDAFARHIAPVMPCEFLPLPSDQADTALVEQFQTKLDTPSRTLIGGFSLGARIAAMVSLVAPVAGLVGLSFPFHRHGQPLERHGLETLRAVSVHTLLIQGTRDSHGNEAQVRGMSPFPPHVQVVWLADANHRWSSRGAQTTEDHAKDAVLAIQSFAHGLVSRPHV